MTQLARLVLLLCAAPVAAQSATVAVEPLTFDLAAGGRGRVDFRGSLADFRWADDGVHLNLRGGGLRHPLTGAALAPPEARDDDRSAPFARALREAGLTNDAAKRVAARMHEDSGLTWAEHDGELWAWRDGGPARRLGTAGSRRILQASPVGSGLSWVRDNDLYVASAGDGEVWRVTEGGSDDRLHGVLDWVYQEEVYGRGDYQAHWWAPTGAAVAFLTLDESKVKPFTVVDHVVPRVSLDQDRHVRTMLERYPKAGDDNPTAELAVASLADRSVRALDLSAYPPDRLIVHVGWTPDGARVVLQVQDRVQRWLSLAYGDPVSGEVKEILREESKTGWVNRMEQPHWLADGSFLWLSERTGTLQVYRYQPDGHLRSALTAEPLVVKEIERVDEERGRLWLMGHDGQATDRHLFVAALDGSRPAERVTRDSGTHSVSFNGDGSLFLDRFSSLSAPPQILLCNAEDGAVLQVLAKSEPADLERRGYRTPEPMTILARDGYPLDATLLKPYDFDPEHSYAVWIETYSGPDAPSVRNSWSSNTWHQFLAQQGALVLQVNVRSASGRGQRHTEACYRQLLVQELADLEDAVRQVTKEPWADAERVGITGWSYGGSMTAYALTHSKLFRLGIAGAGVYDWRLYDSIYTERYMDTPQANHEGYTKTSVIAGAAGLSGHLLLLHGTIDDNVHLQNTIQLVYALQKAGKDDFELMLYPTQMHGVGDRQQSAHMRRLMWRTIREHLKVGRDSQ